MKKKFWLCSFLLLVVGFFAFAETENATTKSPSPILTQNYIDSFVKNAKHIEEELEDSVEFTYFDEFEDFTNPVEIIELYEAGPTLQETQKILTKYGLGSNPVPVFATILMGYNEAKIIKDEPLFHKDEYLENRKPLIDFYKNYVSEADYELIMKNYDALRRTMKKL